MPGSRLGRSLLLTLALLPLPAWAAGESASVLLVRTDVAPVIDGRLDDPAWETAARLGPLTQVVPVEGATPSEPSEVRLLYDRDFLYIGVRAFDSDPEALIFSQMLRDGSQRADDRIGILLDTFHDHRNAFFFSINPAGARLDALVENNRNFRVEWDGIWYAKVSIDAEGWVAEVAIPFKTLSFDPNGRTWGFNFIRTVRRRSESLRWTSALQNRSPISVAAVGEITGLVEIEQGLGLDVKPFASATWRRDHDQNRRNRLFDPGLDVLYRITPSLAGALTVNTDFSEAPVDARQVNLTRFGLFFPETRDFFLEDAGIFNFGGLQPGGGQNPNGLPFFSRRIGLDEDGHPVDLRAGVKLTGRIGRLNLGLLDVQTASHADVRSKNLAVARLSWNVLEESSAGLIFTRGDPLSNDRSFLGGLDFRYRTSQFRGDETVLADAWAQRSSRPGRGADQWAYGFNVAYPNDRTNWFFRAREIQEDFDPALGFVNRSEIRHYEGNYRHRIRPSGSAIRTIDSAIFGGLVTDLGNELETGVIVVTPVSITTHRDDNVNLRYTRIVERLHEPFEIGEGVFIPAGRHDFNRFTLAFGTSVARPLRAAVEFTTGSFFDGRNDSLNATLEWRPSRYLFASIQFIQNKIRVSGGDFSPRIVRLAVNVAFTPDLSWNTLAQYDNVTDELGVNSRIRWIVEPGREVFLVVNQGFLANSRTTRGTLTSITTKLGWTFRF